VKPPRPPIRLCPSPPPDDDYYDNTASTFSYPVAQVRLSPNADDEYRRTATGYPPESSPSQRWVPVQRLQRPVGTPSSKGLSRQYHHAPSRFVSDRGMSLQGDLSVCIGLTVQCTPGPSNSSVQRIMTPERRGCALVDPSGAVVSWPNSRPMRVAPVHSYDDLPADYQSRCRSDNQPDSFQGSGRDISKFRHSRRFADPTTVQSRPQRGLGRDLRIYHQHSPSDWKAQGLGRQSFDDFAVGFEHDETSSSVFEDLGSEGLQGQVGLLDDEEDLAFDEITQQIASLTQTVNELRVKHRRPSVTRAENSSSASTCNSAALRVNRRRRQ